MPSTTQELTSLVLANTVYSKIQESKKERMLGLWSNSLWKIANVWSVDWVDLAIIDLSVFDTLGGKQKLAAQLYNALKNIGEHYISNDVQAVCWTMQASST